MKNKGGRPTVVTPEALLKLEEIFALDGTDEEACAFADISTSALYAYQEKHPEFQERKRRLKERPMLKARRTIVQALEDPNHAFKYAEKKRRKEFGNNLDITTDGEKIVFGWQE